MKKTKKISVTIPDKVYKALRQIAGNFSEYRKTSHFVTDALQEFISRHYPEHIAEKPTVYPSVLSKIEAVRKRTRMTLRSPKFRGRTIETKWKVME